MATIKSKQLQEAFKKVRKVGRAEEPVTIDGCSFVFQSLSGAEYDAALNDISELEGAEYAHGYQLEQVCRSIVEIEGHSLRDADFIEDDVPVGDYVLSASVPTESKANKAREALKGLGIQLTVVPPSGEEERTVVLERHAWVRKLISSWSQEAMLVAFRKVGDAISLGEAKAKEGVEFRLPDESDEDKFRRLLGEAKALEADLPPDLVNKALEDMGYLHKSTPEELEEVAQRAREFSEQQKQNREEPEPEPPSPAAPGAAVPSTQALVDQMRTRTPLNQAIEAPPVSVEPREPVPSQLQPVAVPRQFQQFTSTPAQQRAQQLAQLEGVDQPPTTQPFQMHETTELAKKQQGLDPKGVVSIIDQRPVAGLNPKFRRPPS